MSEDLKRKIAAMEKIIAIEEEQIERNKIYLTKLKGELASSER